MGPYISGFRVYPEDGLEAGPEARQRRAMAGRQEIVILKPIREGSEMATVPAGLQQLESI